MHITTFLLLWLDANRFVNSHVVEIDAADLQAASDGLLLATCANLTSPTFQCLCLSLSSSVVGSSSSRLQGMPPLEWDIECFWDNNAMHKSLASPQIRGTF
mmetsp:Transcript_3007/g.7869  ORF Transcript_3007/g.7869 Transcript_3007/m.7869 type:complete len:101 (+) Transcript_3007:277-579(+)|eukprot:scaffold271315_cov13-Tisochrysis_lutea.AAC.1